MMEQEASVNVMPLLTYLNLGLGELAHTKLTVELEDRTLKYPKGIAENFERQDGLDLEARLIRETLVLNRSLGPFLEDYIKLNDLNEPFELRRNQGDDPIATLRKGGALMNVPIFVGTFYVMIDFAVLEDIDAYRNDGIGDVIFGEPFLGEAGIKRKWFEWIITLYNGDDEVTYQMVRSHPRFERYTNEQCNKIPPLLKVSEEDKKNGILHAYQKLKGFYKGVLNLGPDYIRDAMMEEWLTRRHISVHEME
ncbi:hypothetical protein Tco_0995905 [Tanacetum coccineum]